MDRALVEAYIDLFDRTFRGWLSEWEFLMMGRSVISERSEDFDLLDRKFPYRNVQGTCETSPMRRFANSRPSQTSKLIVISRDHEVTLDRIRQAFPELAAWRPDLGVDFVYATMTSDKKRLIVANPRHGRPRSIAQRATDTAAVENAVGGRPPSRPYPRTPAKSKQAI